MVERLKMAKSYKELIVYQKSMTVSQKIFEITKSFPKEETYSLTDQIRRSSRSIGAQIAEAWGKKRYERHFISKITDADSELQETEHWIDVAQRCGYVSEEVAHQFMKELSEVGRMLDSMIKKSHLFCRNETSRVREDSGGYFVSEDEEL